MVAIDNLNTAVTRLQAVVPQAVTIIQNSTALDPAIQAAADNINAASQALEEAITPPTP